MPALELHRLGIIRILVPIPFVHAGGPANVYALEEEGEGCSSSTLGWGRPMQRLRWRQGFTLSEAVANLEWLESRGQVVRRCQGAPPSSAWSLGEGDQRVASTWRQTLR